MQWVTVLPVGRPFVVSRETSEVGAIGTFWERVWATEQAWSVGQFEMAVLNPGQTLARVHFGVRFTGVTSNEQNYIALLNDFMAFGVVTQSSATGPTAPNALTHGQDANPPLERWLYWATLQMRPIFMGNDHPDVMVWGAEATFNDSDSKGQVKANVSAGHTLQVFLSFAPWTTTAWEVAGPVAGQVWSSCLVLT